MPGLLPCVLTAILLSPRGSSPKDIASTYGFPLNSILELEKLAGNVLVFVDAGTQLRFEYLPFIDTFCFNNIM